MSAKFLIPLFTAFTAASTGPIPTSASMTSLPSMLRLIEAVGLILVPDTMVSSSNWILFSWSMFKTCSAIASRSVSVIVFPLSPRSLTFANISIRSSSLTLIPSSFNLLSRPLVPTCFPIMNFRLCPTSSGVIGSYVELFLITPSACIPDSCANAFSPTIGLFRPIGALLNLDTSFEVL